MKKISLMFLIMIFTIVGKAQNKSRNIFENNDFVIESLRMVNTVGSDISPELVEGELYFSSVPEKYFNKSALELKKKAFYDTYSVPIDQEGMPLAERKLVAGFGHHFHEGPVAFCAATGELFVTISNVADPDTVRRMLSSQNIRLRLVIMKKSDGQWKIAGELPFNDDRFHFAHPAISQTGDTLVFSSDMDSANFGKTDLFMSIRNKGKWSDPQNLGSVVNTGGMEMFPTFLPGGILTFASNGHSGNYGGLDICYTNFPQPVVVKNPGDKINSRQDDFGLIIHNNGTAGYFSSNRSGKGSDDIFMVTIKPLSELLSGKIVDDLTGSSLSDARIQLLDCNNQVVSTTNSDRKGYFEFDIFSRNCYRIAAVKESYIDFQKDISGPGFTEVRLLKRNPSVMIKVVDKETGESLVNSKVEILEGDNPVESLPFDGSQFELAATDAKQYSLYITDFGYIPQTIQYEKIMENKGNQKGIVVGLEKLAQGKQFILEDLYYDLNKYNIRSDAEAVLNRLVRILTENSSIRIEIGSHTDCRASQAYNQRLSQNRSAAVVAFLVGKGISSNRLVAKGYGESQLVNQCSDGISCTESEHQANRRTVIKVLEGVK